MKNIANLIFAALLLGIFMTSCEKENFDNSTIDNEDFNADTIIYDVVNQFSFALSKSFDNQLNVIGGSAGFGTNLLGEAIGNQTKWTLEATVEDGVVITQTVVFYTENEDPGTYELAEYHLDHSDDNNLDLVGPDMSMGDITVTSLSDSIVSGNIIFERLVPDTTYSYSATLIDVINL